MAFIINEQLHNQESKVFNKAVVAFAVSASLAVVATPMIQSVASADQIEVNAEQGVQDQTAFAQGFLDEYGVSATGDDFAAYMADVLGTNSADQHFAYIYNDILAETKKPVVKLTPDMMNEAYQYMYSDLVGSPEGLSDDDVLNGIMAYTESPEFNLDAYLKSSEDSLSKVTGPHQADKDAEYAALLVDSLSTALENNAGYVPEIAENVGFGYKDHKTYGDRKGLDADINKYTGTETDVVVPSYVDGRKVEAVGVYAFRGTSTPTDVKTVEVQEGISAVDRYAFYGSTVEHVSLPDTVTEIGDNIFNQAKVKSVDLPAGLTSITNGMFRASALESIDIPDTVESIGEYAFSGTALKDVVIPGSVDSIGKGAFQNNSLESVTIENGVTHIGTYAFTKNPNLKEVVIPESVTKIDTRAFEKNGANFKLKVKLGSPAQDYAKKEKINYTVYK